MFARLLTFVVGASLFLSAASCSLAPNDACRSQCELAAGSCEEIPIEEFAEFDEELATWRAQTGGLNCEDAFPFVVVGECADGKKFLFNGGGFTALVQYYSAEDDTFVGLETQTDVVMPPCNGKGFWPEPVACEEPTVTEVVCGTLYDVGEVVSLP